METITAKNSNEPWLLLLFCSVKNYTQETELSCAGLIRKGVIIQINVSFSSALIHSRCHHGCEFPEANFSIEIFVEYLDHCANLVVSDLTRITKLLCHST